MTTNSISIVKDFFYFDEKIKSRVINPRHYESLSSNLLLNKNGNGKHIFESNYDIEIFPMDDLADVFCNLKTKMIWNFETETNQALGSTEFAEALLYHTITQKHFATTIIKQELKDTLARLGLLHKPNLNDIFEDLKKSYTFLAPLTIDSDLFYFNYWY